MLEAPLYFNLCFYHRCRICAVARTFLALFSWRLAAAGQDGRWRVYILAGSTLSASDALMVPRAQESPELSFFVADSGQGA